jgi:hypothetical protein
MMRLLRQKQRNEVVLRKLAKGGVFHRPLRIWNLPLCQSEIARPLHQNRLLAAWPGELTEPGEPGQLPIKAINAGQKIAREFLPTAISINLRDLRALPHAIENRCRNLLAGPLTRDWTPAPE